MALEFNKYAQEGNEFVNRLAHHLGHPKDLSRTGIILRAVLHTLRDRLTISEAMDILAQLPMFLKAVYADNWKYSEKPIPVNTVQEFLNEIKKHQDQYGESEFNWPEHTDEIVATVFRELRSFISEGESNHIIAQLPKELEEFYSESIHQ